MKIKDFKGKRVTVMGIGLHEGGKGVIKFFHQIGAKVLATDLRTPHQLRESLLALKDLTGIKYVLGQHRPEDFINTDLVIKNPAVPDDSKFLKIAKDHQIPIETDMGIFFELCPAPIIGVTGTRGKSTTATLIAKFLSQKYRNVVLAGNIRSSVLLQLPKIKPVRNRRFLNGVNKETLVVLELSSWQLEGLLKHRKSPQIAVITNIMPDHLNRYKGMKDYIEAKKIIFKFQSKKDWLILNEEDPIVRKFAKETKSRVIFFNRNQAKKYKTLLIGKHNLSNLAAALVVAKLFKIPEKKIQKVLKNFKGLAGRLELIAEIKGVKYINDTSATIPEATIVALNTLTNHLSGHLILIAGGADKNLNFEKLAEVIIRKIKILILLEGTATDKLEKAVKLQIADCKLQIERTNNMKEAVRLATQQARVGDIVLLSPACASFGLFRHEFERGEAFKRSVLELKR